VDTVPPVAEAGGNFIIIEDTWMRFNGSSSFDTNPVPGYDQIASYTWSFKFQNGSHILLEGPGPSYYFDTMGNYTVTLSVRDSAQNLDSQKFWIRVQDNTTPLAVAGKNFTDDEDIEFFLDAGASTDNDPKFNITGNFTWTFHDYDYAKIEEGRIVEVVLVGSNVTYNFSTPGTYNITLTVTDAAGNFDIDNITVTIRDTEPPVAVATSDKIVVTLGRTVAFSAYKSTDNDPTFPGTGNFTWEFKYIDEEIIFYGLEVDFRFLNINAFTIKLTVTDNGNNSASHTINIIVSADLHLPTVEWTVPGDSGINVRVTTVIKIKLSERLDIEHTPLNLTTFQLLDSSYQPLDGEL
ncbi:MAG: PKD domain-containing protein, partial [Thermoplasmata archaeon]|nr:PKD domain-containing protein [Thermoplasmata archaeon]